MTVKEAKKVVEKVFAEFGIVEHPYAGYTHVLESKIGKLYIRPDYNDGLVSIFCNFYDNPEEAKKLIGHWKYNYHPAKKILAEDFEYILWHHFRKVAEPR